MTIDAFFFLRQTCCAPRKLRLEREGTQSRSAPCGDDDDVELDSEGTGWGLLAHCRQCPALGQPNLGKTMRSREMLHEPFLTP